MSYTLVVRSVAEDELNEAVDWYEQRWPGQGADLIDAVDTVFRRVIANPRAGRMIADPIQRMLVPNFPYAVFYYVRGNDVIVTSVFHTSRDPAIWQGRR
jgi:toxin ParE1/3/4